MKTFRTLVAAFSLYSRFPTPDLAFTEEDLKRTIVFLPLVGAVIGAIILAVHPLKFFRIPNLSSRDARLSYRFRYCRRAGSTSMGSWTPKTRDAPISRRKNLRL